MFPINPCYHLVFSCRIQRILISISTRGGGIWGGGGEAAPPGTDRTGWTDRGEGGWAPPPRKPKYIKIIKQTNIRPGPMNRLTKNNLTNTFPCILTWTVVSRPEQLTKCVCVSVCLRRIRISGRK